MTDPFPSSSTSTGRRLAAVVFTDVAGYSARMQRDEVGTLALVKRDFTFIENLCTQHGGSVLNRMGDGLLLCFPSAVQAVTCALQVQAEFIARKKSLPPEQCLEHRIGIHLGDIFLDGTQVAGDGVNIAARLQTRAVAGGICISQTVHDTVKGKIPVPAIPLGAQHFKNITEAIPIFHLAPEGGPAAPPAAVSPAHRGRWKLALTSALVVAIAAAAYFWFRPRGTDGAPSDGRPVIAVLPFKNSSTDQANAFFADGVHEDILANLAALHDLKVISRTSVVPYRDTKKSLREIAADLKVTHVLEGSVRRAGNQVRITAQFTDARTGDIVWSQPPLDRELTDVFAIQSEIATKVAQALHAALAPREQQQLTQPPTRRVEAYDSYQQARDVFRRGENVRDLVAHAEPLLQRAVELDPKYAVAWAELGRVHLLAYRDLEGSKARLERAQAAIDTAVKITPDDPAVMLAQADYQATRRDFESATATYRKIIASHPNLVAARAGLSEVDQRLGRWSDALSMLREARALDPHGPGTLSSLTDLLVRVRRYDDAQAAAREAASVLPPSSLREYVIALIPFYAWGNTEAIQAIIARTPPEAIRTEPNAIIVQAQWAFTRGDADEVIRIWQASGSQWRFSFDSARYDATAVAAAYLARGDTATARPLLERERDRIAAAVAASPRNAVLWSDLALTRAMLGERSAALEAAEKARTLVDGLSDVLERRACAADLACVYGWAGDKERAIGELGRVLKQPGSATYANVHELKHSLRWRPLQAEVGFQALITDPANNAPLL